ncbi:MAG: hypothetical protein KF847_19725 [Pirellulales bacterium]|nr:hypothetical protein [Pirellulales bacterium]
MAVVNVTQKWSLSSTGRGPSGETFTAGYSVLLDGNDSPDDAGRVARDAAGIPRYNDPAPHSTWVRVRGIEARPESTILFEVTVRYEQVQSQGQGQSDDTSDPLSLPPEIEYGEDVITEPVDEDSAGVPILNSSHEVYNPPLTRDFSDLVILISRNVLFFDTVWWDARRNSVNAGNVTIDGTTYAPGTLRLRSVTAKRIKAGSLTYYALRMEILARVDGHKRRVLDAGYREWIMSDVDGRPVYRNITDDDGNPVTAPVPLDGTGGALASQAPTSAAYVWNEYDLYPTSNFSDLPLGG